MAIQIYTAFVVLVFPVTFAQDGYIGYNYHAPVSPLPMPTNLRPNNIQQSYYSNVPQLQSGFVPYPVNSQLYTGDAYRKLMQNQHYNQGYHSAQSSQDVNHNNFAPINNNANSIQAPNIQQIPSPVIQQTPIRNPVYTNVQPQQPIITKHIYFHLPPDETENVAPVTPTPIPRKKTYNIIFIKLPSQKSTSAAQLQQLINQSAESKTLIYVLVKKPSETQFAHPVTSKPEVFFVKYKEPRNVPQPVDSGLVQVPVPPSGISELLPGQVNGGV